MRHTPLTSPALAIVSLTVLGLVGSGPSVASADAQLVEAEGMTIAGNFSVESVPVSDAEPFPLDASPVIRMGDGPFLGLGVQPVPALFHLVDGIDPVRLAITLDTTELQMFGGILSWHRLHPDELLIEDERYVLQFVPGEDAEPDENAQVNLDRSFPPVEFVAGPPDDTAPLAPDHSVHVTDHGSRPAGPFSAFSRATHDHSINVSVVVADASFSFHDTWLFFEVDEDFSGDVADLQATRWLAPELLTDDVVEIASWSYPKPADDGRRCVVAATEDAYGAIATSDVVCADPVLAGCEGCSSAGATPGSRIAILAMLLGVASRRRRLL